MNILIIAHFTDAPGEKGNNRFKYLAQLLSKNNKVEVVTTSFSHTEKRQRETKIEEGVPYKFTMCYEPGYKKNVSIKRFYSHYVYGRNLYKYLQTIEIPDVLYCAVPSLDAAYVAGKYAQEKKVKFVIDIQDLWPEAFRMVFDLPIISDILFAPLTYMANRVYSMADEIVGVSKTYVNRGVRENKKTGVCVFLGTDLYKFDEACGKYKIIKPENEIWLVYAGTLGHSYNIRLFIDALEKLRKMGHQNIKFQILGDGPLLEEFMQYAEKKQVDAKFWGRKPYEEMVAYLCASDIAVNSICKGAAQSIINKHGDYAAAGLPVINTQENQEYRNLIETYQCGINCGVESLEDVVDAIKILLQDQKLLKRMAQNSRTLAVEKFDRQLTYRVIEQLLYEIIDNARN